MTEQREYKQQRIYFEMGQHAATIYQRSSNTTKLASSAMFIERNEEMVHPSYVFFYDRWTWETGSNRDHLYFTALDYIGRRLVLPGFPDIK